jgi:hypothetical protein
MLTAEQMQDWEAILQELASSKPEFPTAEEAIDYSRRRP